MANATPVDFDPFAGDIAIPQGGGPVQMTVRPQSAQIKATPVDYDPFGGISVGVDVAKSIPSGLAKGTTSLVGLPGDAQSLIGIGLDWLEKTARQEGDQEFANRVAERKAKIGNVPSLLPGSKEVRGAVEGVTGKFYEPQTTPGKFTGKVSEYIPGALAGPGGIVRKLTNFAVIPGVADEGTRELTKGTPAESWAPTVAAVVAGGGASVLNRPSSVDRAVRGAMSPQVDQQAIARAEQLMNDAAQRGVNLTWAEALEQVAPGSGLTNMQRIVESSPGGREVMSPFMAQRPGQIENAARQTFDTVAPPNAAPSTIGPAVGAAAEETVNAVRGAINRNSEPLYTAASRQTMDPATMARIRAAPGWAEARDAIRNNPQLNRYVAGLPDDSIGFLNEVQKFLRQQADNASAPVAQQRNMQVSAGYGLDRDLVRNSATRRSPELAQAIGEEAANRTRYLDPLLQGPLGQLAKRDVTTKRAIEALFPTQPVANSADEITTAVRAVAARNPQAARDLVRAHAETTFNEAAQNLQSGANQFGGAKFAAVIAGNPQQRANLEAAVRALPNGDQIWAGFNRFLEIAQATGTRQAIGSKTAFNTQELKDLSTGGMIGNAAKTGASPSKWVSAISDAWSRWQLGNNLDQLARLLTNPASANRLRAIANMPQGNSAVTLAGQLVTTAQISKQGGNPPK